MISGETRLIADSSASGIWISAVVNRTIARPSSAVRPSTMRAECGAQRGDMAEADQKAPTSAVAISPRTVMTSPSG